MDKHLLLSPSGRSSSRGGRSARSGCQWDRARDQGGATARATGLSATPLNPDTCPPLAALKVAAIRKLNHELGIQGLLPSSFRFLTRLHYCAADTLDPEWGEHEIDYILFARCPPEMKISPNAEEVDDVRFVSQQELKIMMEPSSGLSWSPWFRIIAERFLPAWWGDLDSALGSDKYADRGTIHKLL